MVKDKHTFKEQQMLADTWLEGKDEVHMNGNKYDAFLQMAVEECLEIMRERAASFGRQMALEEGLRSRYAECSLKIRRLREMLWTRDAPMDLAMAEEHATDLVNYGLMLKVHIKAIRAGEV